MDYYNFSKEMQGGYSKLDGTDWYYEAQFWSEMPDLNLGSQAVRDEFDKIVDFWLDLGACEISFSIWAAFAVWHVLTHGEARLQILALRSLQRN